ncbi:MAG: hypothetical protein WCJ87_09390, partial [Burkholderiales bacterium]
MTTRHNFFPRLLCVFGIGLAAVAPAHAQDSKVASDLTDTIATGSTPLSRGGIAPGWVSGQGTSMKVKVLINAQSTDPTLD